MSITFVLSMFMSNTATTAMMLALLVPLVGTAWSVLVLDFILGLA